ncbi:MAG: BlaI/MecI/CopY family transcriptional regulator [Planctomycetota bacterium]|nr:BlaI/MecI/CopY family transcriptional regulator [Planctomycetota bacterium]
MTKPNLNQLSRRERQIMNVIYQLGEASVNEVMELLPDPPSYSAVRALMRVLVEKSMLKHHQVGPRYVYRPIVSHDKAQKSAMMQMLDTFFEGSTERAVAALLDMSSTDLSHEELNRLATLIEQAREEGR